MKTASWKDIAELIGISAIVASLIFVGLEMRQTRVIAMAVGGTKSHLAPILCRIH